MAGMLPGVECARRRRFHQSGGSSDSPSVAAIGSTRRSSFCLYTSNHDTHHSSVSSQQRSILFQAYQDEKLGGVAREAKERLDERLRSQRKSEPKRQNNKESLKGVDGRSLIQRELHTEVVGSRKSGQKRFSWAKLSWKSSDQDECAICLERFKAGETLVYPPCAHRFHSRCLVPWVENNAHCPCCRMGILR
ncbi:probable E3 ubiquitin-protein ligase RHY1A [Durio zibethinus]|uniref:Probable E3 ubiquitin-protein ligase RHY1A n=1 Tax=Durio zibethinus TaxID=66656 RepID=A0A6P5XR69_DURZI|nr:probable E3 ubiquitin-protein ligase RHY1A [Durio zibethinus]XP_022730705.1 probable E3 ubiquitin-protein ligase RHY1A [Durio zibethinus]